MTWLEVIPIRDTAKNASMRANGANTESKEKSLKSNLEPH